MGVEAQDFEYVRSLVASHTGICLDAHKDYLVESRLASLVKEGGHSSLGELIGHLRGSAIGPLHNSVIEAMLTNETLFFRDIHPFEALREKIIPELLTLRASERRLSIWCCACSTGQEPYSVAMLLKEHFGGLPGWSFDITASDFSKKALQRARDGQYNQLEIDRGLPKRYLDKYFKKAGNMWQIHDDLRKLIAFREINIAKPFPPLPKMDLILLRNVLIYFGLENKKAILDRIMQVLRADGYLFLGGAETTLGLNNSFKRVQKGNADCYQIDLG